MKKTRRFFLRTSGLGLVAFGAIPRAFVRAACAAEATTRRKTFVAIFQRGACDGLNAVVPYGEAAYRSLRPTIAVPAPGTDADACLDLDGFFGLHPALAPLLPLWKDGTLAAVQAIGSPDSTRSHFDAQDFMESGTPGLKSTEDGWMNRALLAIEAPTQSPLRAVALTPNLPRSLQGRAKVVAMASVKDFGLRPATERSVVQGLDDMYASAVQNVFHGSSEDAFDAMSALKGLGPSDASSNDAYPRGTFGNNLKDVARLIKAGLGLEMAFVEIGGWDHHAAEGSTKGLLAQRLAELGGGLRAFSDDLGSRMEDVVVVTMTEFGRTARENGNRGTDHGHASASFVMGGGVRGGKVLGRWPGLAAEKLYEGRDLALTTDYRDLLAEALVRHLGVRDVAPVFPGHAIDPGKFPGVLRA